MRKPRLSRRQFLRSAGGWAAAATIAARASAAAEPPTTRPGATTQAARATGATTTSAPATSRPASAASRPAAFEKPGGKSRVVQIQSADVVYGDLIRPDMVHEMFRQGLCALTGAETLTESLQTIFRPDDVIGIKFNRTGAEAIGTTPVFATTFVRALAEAGFDPAKVILIEAPDPVREQLGTRSPSPWWSETVVDFDSGKDRFAAVLESITALVNVPFLKTHNIAGMTGCLKNLSHGLIRRPARYHANRCSPYVADIVAAEPIRSKMRLHLVNAIRALYDEGPAAQPRYVWPSGTIVASFDPVAADTIGVEILNRMRREKGLPMIGGDEIPVPYLYAAQRRHLGTTSWERIAHTMIRL